MNKKNLVSLQKLITRQFGIVGTTLITMFFAIATVKGFIDSAEFRHSKFEGISAIAAESLVAPVEFGDRVETENVIKVIAKDNDIQVVEFVSSHFEGVIVAGVRNSNEGQSVVSILEKDSYLNRCGELSHSGKSLGQLCVRFNSDIFMRLMVSNAIMVLLATLVVLLTVSVVSRTFRKRIATPISELLTTIKRVENDVTTFDHWDFGSKEEQSIQEFEELSSEFLGMVTHVVNRNVEIIKINEGLEEAVEKKTRELETGRAASVQSSKMASLGEMAGGVAHEINNPLAVISGLSRKLRVKTLKSEDTEEIKKDLSESLDKLDKTVDRISRIIKGLRAFARDGEKDPFETVSIQQIFEDTMLLCESRMKQKGVMIKTLLPEGDVKIQCRFVQIEQVIVNLMNNAFDAVADLETKWISLGAEVEGENMLFKIKDSGTGIPKELQEKIMQPFFTTKEIGKGTGLGLSVSVSICRDHGGDLYIDNSSPNTCFVLRIPLKQASQEKKTA